MAKFYGPVGFVETTETSPGVWTEQVIERDYFGDVLQNRLMFQSANQVNDNINLSLTIRILADDYANSNMGVMRYVVYKGAKWEVTSAIPSYPRIELTLGGLYNGR
jgi:hypothetical protein